MRRRVTPATAFAFLWLVVSLAPRAVAQGPRPSDTSPAVRSVAQAVPVEVQPVRRGRIQREIVLTGTIEARSQIAVYAKIPGRIEKLAVDEGDRVEQGQVLAVVDEAKTLGLSVRQAEIQVEAAKIGLDQARTMAKVKLASQLAQAKAGLAAANAAYEQVNALAEVRITSQIKQAEAGLEALKANLRKIKAGARAEERQQVEATRDQAKANLENARRNYERMKTLVDQDVISRQTFEGVETQYRIAQAQLDVAEQQVKLVDEGARPEDIEAVAAQVRRAEAGLEAAKAQADAKSWEMDVQQVKARVAQAEAALKVAQVAWDTRGWEVEIGLAQTRYDGAKTALELARKRLEDATIVAPIGGVIAARNVEVGDHAFPPMPGTPGLFTLVDMETVRAVVSASETDLAALSVGQKARITVSGLEQPVSGTVSFISPTVDPNRHTAVVKVEIDNSRRQLRPGMYAEVAIVSSDARDALLIPRASILDMRDGRGVVFVVEGARSVRRSVEIGLVNGADVQVTNGLSDGDLVIVSGQSRLKNNAPVRVVTTN